MCWAVASYADTDTYEYGTRNVGAVEYYHLKYKQMQHRGWLMVRHHTRRHSALTHGWTSHATTRCTVPIGELFEFLKPVDAREAVGDVVCRRARSGHAWVFKRHLHRDT